jgi:hypothetical protein
MTSKTSSSRADVGEYSTQPVPIGPSGVPGEPELLLPDPELLPELEPDPDDDPDDDPELLLPVVQLDAAAATPLAALKFVPSVE